MFKRRAAVALRIALAGRCSSAVRTTTERVGNINVDWTGNDIAIEAGWRIPRSSGVSSAM